MATRKKTEPKKTAAEDMQAFVDGLGTTVDDRYNAIIERCGLNMPLLLQEILRELMYLRAGK